MVGVAIAGAAVAGVAGSAIQASGAQSAANTEANAAKSAANQESTADIAAGNIESAAQYPAAQFAENAAEIGSAQFTSNAQQGEQEAESNYDPYLTAGQSAENELGVINSGGTAAGAGLANYALTGLNQNTVQQTPGYQFTLNQGLEATQAGAASQGLGVSGAAAKAAASYSTGLADTTYQQQYENAQNAYSDLQGTANLGLEAGTSLTNTYNADQLAIGGVQDSTANQVGTLGGNAILGSATDIAQGLTGAAGAQASGTTSAANAQAAGTTATTGAIASGLNSAASGLSNYELYNSLLGNSSSTEYTPPGGGTSDYQALFGS